MRKFLDFLKSLCAIVAIAVLLFSVLIGVIAEFVPAAIPDWMYVVGQIISIPFWIAFFVVVFKEWQKQRKVKKKNRRGSANAFPRGEGAPVRTLGRMRNGDLLALVCIVTEEHSYGTE